MAVLTSKVEFLSRQSAPFGKNAANPIKKRVATFEREVARAATAAAQIATTTSRANFKYLRNPAGAQRATRESTGGRFANYLEWKVDSQGQIGLDLNALETRAPHWIILELGTGAKAEMRSGGDAEKGGKGASLAPRARLRTVKSQRGRRIHPGLVFADGPGGTYSAPGSARGQQLFARSRIKDAPRAPGIVIKKEIKGQHFVKKGAQAGFREYRRSVLAAARTSFQKGVAR